MRIAVAVLAAAALAAPAALAVNTPTPPTPLEPVSGGPLPIHATAALSSNRAGARPVTLTVGLPVRTICGRPPAGSVTVTFPQDAVLPDTIARNAVRVGGARVASVEVAGRSVVVRVAPATGTQCHLETTGMLRLSFTQAAALGNPQAPGRYAITVRRGGVSRALSVQIVA